MIYHVCIEMTPSYFPYNMQDLKSIMTSLDNIDGQSTKTME